MLLEAYSAFLEEVIDVITRCNVVMRRRQPEAMRQPNPELKAEFGDLVAYRDKIYNEHFPSTE